MELNIFIVFLSCSKLEQIMASSEDMDVLGTL